MSTHQSFRDFEVYQKARALAHRIWERTRTGGFSRDYGLKDQITRAADSIPSNFAEGFEREGTKEFIQFIGYAKGSSGEVRAQLDLAVDRGHISAQEHAILDQEAHNVAKMLTGLSGYLKQSEHRGLKFKQATANRKLETPRRQAAKGAAIISVLLVLTVLTIMVVAFLQSMRIDRLTARAYLNKTKAEMAARAGADAAIQRLVDVDATAMVNAYETASVTHKGSPFTSPYLTALVLSANGTSVQSRTYLASSSDPYQPPDGSSAQTVDINASFSNKPEGWIGLSQSTGSGFQRRTVPVEWIYLRDGNGTITGRYAYWTDDESARIDVTVAGSTGNATASPPQLDHLRGSGSDPSEVSIHLLTASSGDARRLLDFRNQFGGAFPGGLSIFQAANTGGVTFAAYPLQGSTASQTILRTHITHGALADERGATGKRRIQLNEWALRDSAFSTSAERETLALKVVAMGDYINTVLPGWGARYYSGTVSAADQRLYCIKIAANLQDYIDPDRQPTVIRQNLTGWVEPPDPTQVGEGAPITPPAAFGKEVVPAIGEYVGWYYNDGGSLRIDHTFEVWNIHAKPIDLSSMGDVRILVAERNDVTPNSGSSAPDPDLPGEPGNAPLALTVSPGTVIGAGTHALLTTLPSTSAYDNDWVSGSPQKIRLTRSESTYAYGSGGLRMEGDQLATSADVDTEIVVANQYGYLDIQPRIAQQGVAVFTSGGGIRRIATQSFGNDGSGSPNSVDTSSNNHRRYPLDSADPRSLTEIYPSYGESGGSRSSIAWRRNQANNPTPPSLDGFTLLGAPSRTLTPGINGLIPDNSGITPQDYVPEPFRNLAAASALEAVSVIRDGPMRTIGELGLIYDPAVGADSNATAGVAPASIRRRGGFRTLAVGSRVGEGLGPNRLTHVGPDHRAYRLLELFTSTNQRGGKILLNSMLRDDRNLAWRALLDQLKTQTNDTPDTNPDGDWAAPRDPNFPGSAASAFQVDATAFVAAATARMSIAPLLALGELGELDIFNSGSALFSSGPDMTPNAANTTMLDRGREEIFRRLVGLLTLKGSVYRVHVIGQAGQLDRNGSFVVRSTARLVRTVELERTYPSGSLDSTATADLQTNNTATATVVRERGSYWE